MALFGALPVTTKMILILSRLALNAISEIEDE